MNRQYHFLVAGLPDLFFDDKKTLLSTKEYRTYLEEHLPNNDLALIKLYFWRYDNQNLLQRLENPEAEINGTGNLDSHELDEFIAAHKNDSVELLDFSFPSYFIDFMDAFRANSDIYPGKSWEVQLTELYYNDLIRTENAFVNAWFIFERDLSNLLTAFNCRNNNWYVEKQLIGNGELNEKLTKSSARDFGLNDEIEGLEEILKALEETDLLEQEKKIDLLKWKTIEDHSFFHFFSIEKLFAFLIQLGIAERWISLDKETGLKLFKELLKKLESSYELPPEFS